MLTTCTRDCPDRCSVLCSKHEEGLRLSGNPSHPYTKGFLCSKIKHFPAQLSSPERIVTPWVRKNGELVESDWDEALGLAAAAAKSAHDADPGAVLLVRGGGSFGISQGFANYVFGLMGARFTKGNLCHAAGLAGIAQDAGGLEMNDPEKIAGAKAIVLWSKNPSVCSVHTAAQVTEAKKAGATVAGVNPDTSALKGLSEFTLRIKPGTDRYLALALSKLLLASSGEARARLDAAANGDEFKALLERRTLDELLALCGVMEEQALALLALYSSGTPPVTLVGWGLQRYRFGAENVRAIHALCYLSGSYTPYGGGFYYADNPFRHVRFPRPGVRRAPSLRISALAEDLAEADPPVRFAWISCSNIVNQSMDAPGMRAALDAVETVVAVEGFWTDTARVADIVLPPTLWLETEDVAGSYWHNTLGAVRRVVEPPPGCLSDFEILLDFASRLALPVPFKNVDEWLEVCLPDTITLDDLREVGWVRFPNPAPAFAEGFGHEDGKFHLIGEVSDAVKGPAGFPFRLLSLTRWDATNSQLAEPDGESALTVRMHPEGALRAGVEEGDRVLLFSETGSLEAWLTLDAGLHPEAVACPRGGWVSMGNGANALTSVVPTDAGDGAAFYETRVRVEPAA